MYQFFEQIMTATVETVSEQLDLATIMPTEKVMSAVARAVTLTETDVGWSFEILRGSESVKEMS